MTIKQSYKKTRIAPTPSGFLHLGNVYSFSLTAAMAKQTGARILLRIDDLDRERAGQEFIRDIFDTLDFLEIPFDEGPKDPAEFEAGYSQMCRLKLYADALKKLEEKGAVYACSCSRAEVSRNSSNGTYNGACRHKKIPLNSPDVCWRLDTLERKELTVRTLPGEIIKEKLPAEMADFIVRKKDGFAAYQLASVIDDLHFGIDLIIRGQDLWHSTLAQLYLAEVLEEPRFLNTTFRHHSLLLTPDEKKLSKSAGDTSVQYLRRQGKTKEDIYALLGTMLKTKIPLRGWEDLIAPVP